MSQYAEFYDQLRTREGWRFTEDITFTTRVLMNMNLASAATQVIPIDFINFPNLSLNQSPGAIAAYLVLRRLTIGEDKLVMTRFPLRVWLPSVNTTFSAINGGGNATVVYQATPVPALTPGPSAATSICLRRIHLGTLPTGVVITKVEVRGHWASNFDDLKLTSPISGDIDLGQWYDSQYGLVNAWGAIQIGGFFTTTIDIRLTYTNSNGTPTPTPYVLYGTIDAIEWAQWLVQYQDWNSNLYTIGNYDDVSQPTADYQLDRVIPVPITDAGQAATQMSFGNLVFTMINSLPFYSGTTTYNLTVNATIAYLLPV